MVGFRNDHGTYPHLDIRVEGTLRNLNEDGEECWPEETELEGDLNLGYRIVDFEDLELEDEESYSLGELFAMTDVDDEGATTINYDEYYDSFDADWLYQGEPETVASAEVDEDEEGLGRPTSGARYRHHLTRYGSERKSRIWSCGERRGTNIQRCPKWQQRAGGGKRGRQSIRYATPQLPEPMYVEDHFDTTEVDELARNWSKHRQALSHIRKKLAAFVEFDEQPLKLAA